jgi:hypothetical protein
MQVEAGAFGLDHLHRGMWREPLNAPAVNCGPDHATIVELAATTPANTVATRARLITIANAV